MRKAQKKQSEDFIKLLGQAHVEVRKAIEKRQNAVAMDLLEQCQDGAIELGNMIEAEEGEGFITIPLLEQYCELVYQIHEELWKNQYVSGDKAYKGLRKSLIRIENSVKNDIKVHKEAVFLPYKASMWDSLESIWKAADQDPDWEAYVIPIPYYDKNPDGSFGEMHYEGGLYPDYVPITGYEAFDFEEHYPDMIFIHNPYDECNYVTSVHPFFYSKNLKKYTDQLVYIPYFILEEPNPDDPKAVERIEHFCTVPGVIYADKVIVQSEAMRQVYINVMTDFTAKNTDKNSSGNRKYWQEKILGLGSPKVEKVLSTKKEELQLPKEWLPIIQKPDGSWKKIIFYNTGVTALLQNSEKYLDKMREVFQVFREVKGEVTLLWRPHPLIQTTIEAMRPELWQEYCLLVNHYKEEGWGIYDDSPDMDRAIALSDAYYGDWSSMVQLCQAAGIPVLVQNVDIIQNQPEGDREC
ncbi:hypothetical protein AALB16_13165 [Lachnospiraceae bacterium 62-35]